MTHVGRVALTVVALLSARTASIASAQAVDTALAAGTLARFAATCDVHGRGIWGVSLCGPVVLVHAPTRAAVASERDPDGRFVQRTGAWFGSLPAGLPTANTTVTWNGTQWVMALLPLPADEFDRIALVAHEAFHAIQPSLGHGARDAHNPHLDEEQGRLWLRLELRALAAALRGDGGDGIAALHDALHFRAHRHRLYPGADTLETLLERHEGLAEYTGVLFAMSVLGAGMESVLRGLETFERRRSWVRALGYGTGPALGLLLDRHAPGWREHAGTRPLTEMLADATGFRAADGAAIVISDRAARYGYAEVAAQESARAATAAARLAEIRARLLDGPVLVLQQHDLRATFNPNELVPVPEQGTYYPTGTFQAAWGRLEVTAGGALVSPDWQMVRVPAAAARIDPGSGELIGDGWRLELAAGWTARPAAAGAWRLVHMQAQTDRNAIRLEASYLAAAVSYARRGRDNRFYGGGIGLGIEIVQALASPVRLPAPDIRHAEIVHLAGFVGWVPSPTLRTDVGVRAALVYYGRENVNAAGFAGPYIAPAIGSRRFKVGSRLQVGYLHAAHHRGVAVLLQPVVVSATLPW